MKQYALLQTEIEPPTFGQVRDALGAAQRMDPDLPIVAMDAGGIVRDAFGVLVRQLTQQQARTLQQAFTGQNCATATVAEDQLLDLPPMKATRQLVPDRDALKYADVRRVRGGIVLAGVEGGAGMMMTGTLRVAR